MQLLSPAHLVFVLWLLAAAAPVATVLINGAMVPLTGTNVRIETTAVVEAKTEEAKVQNRPRVSIARHEDTFGAWTAEVPAPGISSSLLHTELQRHRPRVV